MRCQKINSCGEVCGGDIKSFLTDDDAGRKVLLEVCTTCGSTWSLDPIVVLDQKFPEQLPLPGFPQAIIQYTLF